jgi:glutamate carboxypeptidase
MSTTQAIHTFLTAELDHYLSDLRTLAAIDSGPHDRAGANRVNDWLAGRLQALGFTVTRRPHEKVGDTLQATLTGSGTANILLLGHSDTVFPAGTAAARPVTIDGPKLLGPGTCDMKAGLLTGLYASAALQQIGFEEFGTLTYLCVADEELPTRWSIPDIREAVRGQDAVLTLEAARENGDIVTARKGNAVMRIAAHGHSAHAGVEPEKGRNAILGLVRRLDEVAATARPDDGITVNLGIINGGSMTNVVPDRAEAALDIRSFDNAGLEETRARIEAVFDRPDPAGIQFTLTYEAVSPPMPRTPAIAHLEGLAQQAAAELGFTVHGASTGGAADAAFAAEAGVPALDGLGPVGGLDHSPDEYILLDSIVPRTAMLARLLMLIAAAHTGGTD